MNGTSSLTGLLDSSDHAMDMTPIMIAAESTSHSCPSLERA